MFYLVQVRHCDLALAVEVQRSPLRSTAHGRGPTVTPLRSSTRGRVPTAIWYLWRRRGEDISDNI